MRRWHALALLAALAALPGCVATPYGNYYAGAPVSVGVVAPAPYYGGWYRPWYGAGWGYARPGWGYAQPGWGYARPGWGYGGYGWRRW